MRWQAKVALVTLGVASALVAVIWIAREPSPPDESAHQTREPVTLERPEQPATTVESGQPSQDPLLEADPQARELAEREQFHARVRTFFAEAPALSHPEKVERTRGLAEEISRYEAAGELSAAEALLLQTALIRETVMDSAVQAARIAALQRRYQDEGERRKAEWQARPDPAFALYKAREREIVAEVNSMTEIPNGLTRNEYLRQRLQRAREEASAAAH